MRKLKFVLFDCDGVLIDSEWLASRAECEVKNELGFPITLEEQITRFMGRGQSDPFVLAEIEKLPADYVRLVDERCNTLYRDKLKPISGVLQTLEALEALQIPKCVASNSEPDSLKEKLQMTGLQKYFPASAFHAKNVKNLKPAPDLYLFAAGAWGWDPSECLVVEDSVHGVKAGKAAGMTVCGFLGGRHILPGHADRLTQAGADYLISNIQNVLRFLSGFYG